MHHVLVVDDEGRIREVVRFALERAGYRVSEAEDGRSAIERFERERPDAIVLDVLIPEPDGLEVCRRIRARSDVPILFLTSRDEEVDRVVGLELGADDYIVKPFSPRELVARVKAALRRASGAPAPPPAKLLRHGPLALDDERHEVRWGDTPIELTATEFALLRTLLRRPGFVYGRGQLVADAYGLDHHVTERTVDSHVRRIRKKLRDAGADPIETIHGVGYKLR